MSQDISKRVQFANSLKGIWEVLEEFCSTSTLHGVGYIGDKKRHVLDRVWWIFAVALSAFLCGALIFKAYAKWDHTPIIVTFDEKPTSIIDIPFPAVTICPADTFNETVFNFTHVINRLKSEPATYGNESKWSPPYNITDEEEEYLKAGFQVCNDVSFRYFEVGGDFTDASITTLLRKLGPSLDDMMATCLFNGKYCHEYLQETITSKGMCFTFNMLRGEELYTEDKILEFRKRLCEFELTYPLRVHNTYWGLILEFSLGSNNPQLCDEFAEKEFKLFLHAPAEAPQRRWTNIIKVRKNTEVQVSLRPHMMISSEGIRYYKPNRRGCFFQSERKLRYLKVYTQRNCEMECISNATLILCGCVKFSMLRAENTPICGVSKINCCWWVALSFYDNRTLQGSEAAGNCNCLPACVSITYETEIYERLRSVATPGGIVKINFKDVQFPGLKRSELYGPIDFVANCGGLLGLFIGASFLSIVELLYFFFIRSCRKFLKIMKRMPPKQKNQIADSEVPQIIIYH